MVPIDSAEGYGGGCVDEKPPKVSVVMPVKNGELFIVGALESLYRQSYQDFEVLIVDNGSEDRTREICERMIDSRTRLIPNSGNLTIADALNLGISLANGEYIARLDCDDLAQPSRFRKQVDFLDSNPDVGIVGSWMKCFGERRKSWKYPQKDTAIRLSILFRSPFGHPSVMFRAAWEGGNKGFYDPLFDFAEDLELWTRICSEWRAANIPEFLTFYRTHPRQATKSNLLEREDSVRRILDIYRARMALPPPPTGASPAAFVRWWRLMSARRQELSEVKAAEIWTLAGQHYSKLLRAFLRKVLIKVGLIESYYSARNLVERSLRL